VTGDGTYMGFVGVTTGSSSIRRIFPAWADELGLPTDILIGHDVAPDAPAHVYRTLTEQIRADPKHRGCLITTHKMAMFTAASELFDDLDDLAAEFGEISSMYKRDGKLFGAARDPLTVRAAAAGFIPADHFATTGAQVLCMGSGGSGLALTHQLGTRADRPSRITCTARSEPPLHHLRAVHTEAGLDPALYRYVVTPSPRDADALLAELAPASLVVNATGLGKDRPGSPLTDTAVFPERALVWEFNYRGSLEFLHQAEAQRRSRSLTIEDGWRYFVHGWSQVIADVFDISMPPTTVANLARVAASIR
jgi:shikimate dehydrogenase